MENQDLIVDLLHDDPMLGRVYHVLCRGRSFQVLLEYYERESRRVVYGWIDNWAYNSPVDGYWSSPEVALAEILIEIQRRSRKNWEE